MEIAGLPIWGQLSIFGASFAFNVVIGLTVMRGDLITKREQDRRDKAHAAEVESRDQQISEWRALWQTSQDALTRTLDGNAQLAQAMEVFERFIKSLPGDGDGHEH